MVLVLQGLNMDFELFKLSLPLESESEGTYSVLHEPILNRLLFLITCILNKCLPSLLFRGFLSGAAFLLALGLLDFVCAKAALAFLVVEQLVGSAKETVHENHCAYSFILKSGWGIAKNL